MAGLDAHARPPERLRSLYKRYQKISLSSLDQDPDVIDFARTDNVGIHPLHQVSTAGLADALSLPSDWSGRKRSVQAYGIDLLPGLHIIPGLLDSHVQRELLDRLLHRDLAAPRHKTNISLHYHIPYEVCKTVGQTSHPDQAVCDTVIQQDSFFTCSPSSDVLLTPLDASMHKSLTINQFLNRKLRWVTLGGQYDWTRKVYPPGQHPDFPPDIAATVSAIFPEMRPESAICNLYTPGDTLSLHRDVSEEVDAGLASLSIGCDALFIVGVQTGDGPKEAGASAEVPAAVMRLRSGDAIYMSGPTRFAWHGVPQVIRGTCPAELASWPADCLGQEGRRGSRFSGWQGWLAKKRINLNVRQMHP